MDIILQKSSKNGELEKVKELVAQGANIHSNNEYSLREAASNGHIDVVKFLVEYGANVQAEDNYSLQWAAREGHLEVVKYLVSQGADPSARNYQAITSAAYFKHFDILKFLFDWSSDYKFKEKTLIYVCKNGNLELVKYIHSLGIKNEVALAHAADNGHLNVVKYLISNGYDIHYYNNYALRLAADSGHIEVVKYLVSLGAIVDDNNNEAISLASKKGHIRIVKYLVKIGATISAESLINAAETDNYNIVQYFLLQGADIHAFNDEALIRAARNGNNRVVQELLNKGANISAQENKALKVSAGNGHTLVVEELLNRGATLNPENDYMIIWPVINYGYLDILKLLIEKTNMNININNGYFLRSAAETKNTEIIHYLLSQGANINLAIKESYREEVRKELQSFIVSRQIPYTGELTERTEIMCGICWVDMDTVQESIVQCETCKKCIHLICYEQWNGKCVYCNTYIKN